MKKVLFFRDYKKTSGGHIKVRDYFQHCQNHPGLDPYIYFTPNSSDTHDSLWGDIARKKIVRDCTISPYDFLFVAGKDWEFLPDDMGAKRIVNLIQHVRHGDPTDVRFSFLRRSAFRICVSAQVREAIASNAMGEIVVINNGVPLNLFHAAAEKTPGSILIWARKNRSLGIELHSRLAERGLDVKLLKEALPRKNFARELGKTDIFVALPHHTEGFYLPALEAMASGCAVICSDAIGNRDFCIDGETCLMPPFDDLEAHLLMMDRLLTCHNLKQQICRNGLTKSHSYSLEAERKEFYSFLHNFVL